MEKIQGTVIHGNGIGKDLGFPTANLDSRLSSISLEEGVYAAYTHYDGNTYESALVIDRKRKKVEVQIFDFSGDLYGKQLSVTALKQVNVLLPVYEFEDLKKQIQENIDIIQYYFFEKKRERE